MCVFLSFGLVSSGYKTEWQQDSRKVVRVSHHKWNLLVQIMDRLITALLPCLPANEFHYIYIRSSHILSRLSTMLKKLSAIHNILLFPGSVAESPGDFRAKSLL